MLETDFPKTMVDFEARFGTEQQCREYLARQKWPDGFRCTRCGGDQAWQLRCRSIWVCARCEHHHSLTAGTVLHGTRRPLRHWFLAMYLVNSSKRGLAATELQRHLGCCYQTAWTWLHKLRIAMAGNDPKPLSGTVEVDEAYFGGPRPGKHGRGSEDKVIVVCMAQKRGLGIGRIRLDVIQSAGFAELERVIRSNVTCDSRTITDGFRAYVGLGRSGYAHETRTVKGSGKQAHEVLPCVHRVFSLLRRRMMGTYHGGVSARHLRAYLQEYTFQFNRRAAKTVTHLFQRLMERVVQDQCLPYRAIVGGHMVYAAPAARRTRGPVRFAQPQTIHARSHIHRSPCRRAHKEPRPSPPYALPRRSSCSTRQPHCTSDLSQAETPFQLFRA